MAQTQPPTRTLGEYEIGPGEAQGDDNFRVLELPADLVDEHLTKTFRPSRYTRVCRDVAYFSQRIGSAPKKGMGQGYGNPGSGMRRAREGALYNLAHREALLSRAVDLEFIELTNDDGFDTPEGEWRFDLQPRGAWFLELYYGEHQPVRKVEKKKLSRWSAATNVRKIVVDEETAEAAKSVESWNEQVKSHNSGFGDVDTGCYHVPRDPVDAPETDPAGEELVTWIDTANMPTQFDVEAVSGDVRVACDVEQLAQQASLTDPEWLTITLDESGLLIEEATETGAVSVPEDNGRRLGIDGDYEPFVASGAKDALKEATDAEWEPDYFKWYIQPEEFLVGVEAMLEAGLEEVTVLAETVATYTEYL